MGAFVETSYHINSGGGGGGGAVRELWSILILHTIVTVIHIEPTLLWYGKG